MGNLFSWKQEPLQVLAFGLGCVGLTTSLCRLWEMGFTDEDIKTSIQVIGFAQEIANVKKDESAGFAPLHIISWVRPTADSLQKFPVQPLSLHLPPPRPRETYGAGSEELSPPCPSPFFGSFAL